MATQEEQVYTSSEARKILEVSTSSFKRLVDAGKIRKVTPPNKKQGFYVKEDVDKIANDTKRFTGIYTETSTGNKVKGGATMSLQPRIEARVSALERRQSNLEARTEEVNEDVAASIKQLSEDITKSFDGLADYQIKIEATMATKEDIEAVKAVMATKEDMSAMETRIKEDMFAMETRILDAFKQLLATMNPQ